SLDAKIQVYDKGLARASDFSIAPETFAEFQIQLRVGDLLVPKLSFTEPLQVECQHFIDCIEQGRQPLTDGESGLRTVHVLEASGRWLRRGGPPAGVLQS